MYILRELHLPASYTIRYERLGMRICMQISWKWNSVSGLLWKLYTILISLPCVKFFSRHQTSISRYVIPMIPPAIHLSAVICSENTPQWFSVWWPDQQSKMIPTIADALGTRAGCLVPDALRNGRPTPALFDSMIYVLVDAWTGGIYCAFVQGLYSAVALPSAYLEMNISIPWSPVKLNQPLHSC